EELAILKDETIKKLNLVKLDNYRENEKIIITQLIDSYTDLIQETKEKEQVNVLFESYTSISSSIKTDKELYQEEMITLVND
ncbi:hypothetical protein, partial [Escherichia coli]|uniref:hypothetical protein n=1 Tax=Escherichia coli TaxID=562 RepID=UPI00390C4CEF